MDNKQNKETKETGAKKSIILGVGLVVLAMVLLAASGFIFFGKGEDIITGQAEVDEVRISGKVPGRISEFLVEEGQRVRRGDTLVRIYSPEVLAKLEQAEAAKAAAMAQNQKAIVGARKEQKEGAYELWQKAKAEHRVKQLELAEARSKINLQIKQALRTADDARRAYATALSAVKMAEENMRYAKAGYDEGVIPLLNYTMAQTAWMSAQDSLIDAQIRVLLTESKLKKILAL